MTHFSFFISPLRKLHVEPDKINRDFFMDHYKQVGKKKLDGHLLEIADVAVAGAGDGRISKDDAQRLLAAVIEDNVYTDVERATIDYIHKNYHWTESARDWFRDQIRLWEREFEKLIRMTPEQISKEHFPTEDVLTTADEKEARKKHLNAAVMETYQDHDEIGLIVRLASGRRVEVYSNFIELEGSVVELRGGFHIPLRAIERVET
jgi:hypothetical protein